MNSCYYCGRNAELVCDYYGHNSWQPCRRNVCDEHSVPEFEGGDKQAWTLCKDHAWTQKMVGESTRDWAERINKADGAQAS